MKNPTTRIAQTLERWTDIPVVETQVDDNDGLWVWCRRCGLHHRHDAASYTQGLLAAKCEPDDPLIKPDMPDFYYAEIIGFATGNDVQRLLKSNQDRRSERLAYKASIAKQEAFRTRLNLPERK